MIQGNNIANVNTYGYKNEQPAFGTLMYGMVNGVDGAQLPKGSGAVWCCRRRMITGQGLWKQTGRKARIMPLWADGFFALYDPATGEVSYTRDGSFALALFPGA